MQRLTQYSVTLNKFISPFGIFTCEEIDQIDREEKQWKESQKNYSFSELIIMYPQATKIAKKHMRADLKKQKELLKWLADWRAGCNDIINKVHFQQQDFYKEWFDDSYNESRQEIERKIKKLNFNLSHLEEKKETKTTRGVSEQDILRAKEVPITDFFTGKLTKQSNKTLVGRCPFHLERNPSFTIYTTQNTWWCFSCNSGGTVIDFLMRQIGVDFLTAVKQLLK